MAPQIPVPRSLQQLLERHRHEAHLGLLLDKYVASWKAGQSTKFSEDVQRPSTQEVAQLARRAPSGLDWAALRDRRHAVLASAQWFVCRTRGPFTLHLARASALVNAGICLHPIYGFVYLPGTGLKGMAHAYACECWLPAQGDRQTAWERICQVFGWADSPAVRDLAKRLNLSAPKDSCAGQIVFHEAWPTKWPPLVVDIVNNHHSKYYQAPEGDNQHPPGDWEDPVPVYFLAVPPGVEFEFALSKRRRDVDDQRLELAKEWLLGALCHLGAGAKTAAGYGSFELTSEGSAPALLTADRAVFEATLELVTPAFLAGAEQNAHDCDLRPATLRGLLRWWWRTLHAGHVDVATLRKMEAAVWGDTNQGGAIRVDVAPLERIGPFPRPGKLVGKNENQKDVLKDDREFFEKNEIPHSRSNTTQGLFYAAYGTDEMKTGDVKSRNRRWCLAAGSRWRVIITARSGTYHIRDKHGRVIREESIDAQTLRDQARAALWLLCHYGGVGAKWRKGFGSLTDSSTLPQWTREDVTKHAAAFRDVWRQKQLPYRAGSTGTPTLDRAKFLADTRTPWTNPWFALDQIGCVMQAFAQASPETGHGKHCSAKASLGLPRKIHGPRANPLPRQRGRNWKPPADLKGPRGNRHAAPVIYHLARDSGRELTLRAVVFETDYCYDNSKPLAAGRAESQEILRKLVNHLEREFKNRIEKYKDQGRKPTFPTPTLAGSQGSQASKATLPNAGDRVNAELLEEKTKKGGWKAKHRDSGLVGPIQNWSDVPADKKPGDAVLLIVRFANVREIAFRYPTPADDQADQARKGSDAPKGKGKSSGRRR